MQSIEAGLQRPRLAAEEVARIQSDLNLLASRRADDADRLRETLHKRLTDWRPVLDLQPPFENAADWFSSSVEADGKALHFAGGTVATTAACRGNVRLEAAFQAARTPASRFGLLLGLDASPEGKETGYGFFVAPAPAGRGGGSELLICRNEAVLRREAVATHTPWRLTVSRVAERLSFQVNDRPPVEFLDIFPLPDHDSRVFAVECSGDVPVTLLRASVRPAAQTISPLEHGDELYARNRFNDAADEYGKQAVLSAASEFGQEARFKQGLCLLKLHRTADAAEQFERLGKEQADQWPPLALCQLWSARLNAGEADQAYAVFEMLAARYPAEGVRPLVPLDLVASIIDRYHTEAGGTSQFFYHANLARSLARADSVEEFFNLSGPERDVTRYWLCRMHLFLGESREGLRLAEQLVRSEAAPGIEKSFRQLQLWESYAWLLRLEKQPERALQEIDAQLSGPQAAEFQPLLVERARVHAALGRWEEAEKDLDELSRRGAGGKARLCPSCRGVPAARLPPPTARRHGSGPAGLARRRARPRPRASLVGIPHRRGRGPRDHPRRVGRADSDRRR